MALIAFSCNNHEAKLRKRALAFSELCGAERSSLLKRITFRYFSFVFTFSLFTFSISRSHGTEKEKEQPDWRKYRLPLETYKCFSKSMMSGHLKTSTPQMHFQCISSEVIKKSYCWCKKKFIHQQTCFKIFYTIMISFC